MAKPTEDTLRLIRQNLRELARQLPKLSVARCSLKDAAFQVEDAITHLNDADAA